MAGLLPRSLYSVHLKTPLSRDTLIVSNISVLDNQRTSTWATACVTPQTCPERARTPRSSGESASSARPSEAAQSVWALQEHGASLIEILLTLALGSVLLVSLLAALSTGIVGTSVVDERTIAHNLAVSQIERIKQEEPPYSVLDHPGYEDFIITISGPTAVPGFSSGLQVITVTVHRNGKPLIELEDYKRE